jgi:hypothetical protein
MNKYYTKRRTDNAKGKKVRLVLAVLLIAALSILAFSYFSNRSNSTVSDEDGINYGPPTEEERRSADEVKEKLSEDNDRQDIPRDDDDKIIANVVVVDASQYGSEVEVRAFVSNHIQDGTCTISFSKPGQQTIQKEVQARADASTSICGNVTMDRAEFPSDGDWTVVVSYNSQDAKGNSSERKLTLE